jgi:hypothetical protein
VNLTEWAHAQGIQVTTAYCWYREGTLPVPARKAGRLILVSPDTAAVPPGRAGPGLYARVSCHDQEAGLDRQVARLSARAAQADLPVEEDRWRAEWDSARLFLTADGEKDKSLGNETIRWHPGEGWLEIRLPAPLGHLANRRHGRYRLSCGVGFSYRGDEVAAQTATGAVRYDISRDPAPGRWYLDASWKTSAAPAATLDELRASPVMAVDVNAGHLAVAAVAADGNVLGTPAAIPLDLTGRPHRITAGNQATQHRPGPPASQDHILLVQ